MIAIAITVAVAPIQPAVLVLFQQIVNKYLCQVPKRKSRSGGFGLFACFIWLCLLHAECCSSFAPRCILWGSAFDVLRIVIGGQTDDDERVSSAYRYGWWVVRSSWVFQGLWIITLSLPPQINHIYDVCMLCHSQCVQADKYIPDHKCNHDYYGRRKQLQQVARQCSIDAYVLKSVSWTMNPRISFSFSYRYCLSMQNEDDELTLRVSNITMACGTYVCFHTNRYFFALVLTSHTLCQPI